MTTFAGIVCLIVVAVVAVVEGPAPEDVKAGWLGLGVFVALAAAVAFLGFSLRKHLRKVDFEEAPDRDSDRGGTPPV